MGNQALIDLVSSFMKMDRAKVEAIDQQVGGLFVSHFLQQRMRESLDGRDSLTREALSQFVFAGLYANVDPTNERSHIVSGFPAINHSYPNSVTLSVTRTCHVKCTYCFRGDLITPTQTYDAEATAAGIDWISAHENIATVVVTGGDPFTLPPRELAGVVRSLAAIPTVNEIRLDTRVLTVKPSSVTNSPEVLDAMSAADGKVWLYSQINSAAEFHPVVDQAVAAVRRTGVPIVNQAVILKNVNHTPALMRDMVYACVKRGIRTDYLYLLDGGSEIDSPFNVTDDEIRAVFRELWSPATSGLAKPRAVYVDPLTNTKAQLLVAPWDGNEKFLDDFLQARRDKFARAAASTRP
ncbi:KamA family protein [Catenulispora sp. EB89]|uniref:radical SAM protein n=1 Tax=Catenulispora sp. EB89 TaxID=3156257 RepID=UPI003513A46C